MSSTVGGGSAKQSRSTSAVIADTGSGYHILRIDGYSSTKGTPTGEYLKSRPFNVGSHRWCIRYYPNGNSPESAGYISLLLHLDESATNAVKAQWQFRFVRDVSQRPLKLQGVARFGSNDGWGCTKFIKRRNLEKSGHLKDDSFSVRCDIVVVNAFRAEDTADADADAAVPSFVFVPPSNLHQHLGDLLQSEKGADVVFDVGGQTFAAHRCVLAARSPVFSAELFGAMKESDGGCVVHIDDMEAQVFKALLGFIYTNILPEVETEEQEEEDDVISPSFIYTNILSEGKNEDEEEAVEEDVMAQHLLVAADRYNLERLKLICEEKLCKYIDVGTVATILTLAEQHHCHGLKKACFNFLSSSANLRAVLATDGFEHLSTSIMKELIAMLGNLVQ
ncbi:hypothetical protein EJB05_22267, partial [Eragrostis curvula]